MSSAFDEVQFPVKISMGSTGGPMRQTQVVIKGSGAENRNSRWVNSRRTYDISYGLHSEDDIHAVIMFWEARNGRLIGFRFKDWSDYKSCGPDDDPQWTDQIIGYGDGVTTVFQLSKGYLSGPSGWQRKIIKPVAGTVQIGINGTRQPSGYAVDYTTGLVTFVTPPAGGSPGAQITAGFEFDVPVRFDTDKLVINLAQAKASKLDSILIIELPS